MGKYINTDVLEKSLDEQLRRIKLAVTNDVIKLISALLVHGIHLEIENTPTAVVRENVHAHWEESDKYGNRKCSKCNLVEHVPTLMGKPIVWDYCPNCGSRMDERKEDD